jgi:solute carrier family 25 carnitine/acylcarnitine transporter 20/29
MPEDDAAPKPKASAAWAGLASGAAQVLAEHPLDTIKIRLQSRALAFDVLEGPRAVASKALSEEGVSALFRGLVPRLLTYAPVKSTLFAQYDF